MKFRSGLFVGAAFIAGVAVGPASGLLTGTPIWAIGTAQAQNASGKTDTYNLLRLFGDVFDRIRAEYVEPVNDRDLVENAINGMLTGLDPHSSYMNAKSFRDMQVQTHGEFGGLGLEVTQENGIIKVVSPIDDTPAARAGIKAGDLITTIDKTTVQGLSLNDAVDKMRGPPNSPIHLVIKRENVDKPIELTLNREVIRIQVVKSHLEGDIGYVRLTQFNEQTDSGLRAAVAKFRQQMGDKLHGIVLDLRNNPGGLLDQAVSVSDDFIEQGEIVSTRARHPEDSQRWNAKPGDITGGLPVVVLTNGGSASASEIVAGALQDHHRAVILGQRTFGKGSVQTVIPLPGNGAMRLTTARYYTPSGRSIQGLGITPDVPVAASRTETAHFGPEREADLNHVLTNEGGTPNTPAAPRADLPPIASSIPKLPPENWPAFDATKPETDFQLQQGLAVVRAMSTQQQRHADR
ncbi:S41 family peptidase [Acidisphaera sp. L21]|uniref:S41 family peptidase n=1 Tax=Acidisphaera sp. L21 TaxID=1641851 RepID=UPI00131AE927|nr:S41 family peptidase [Acidisphaera sp. L21]